MRIATLCNLLLRCGIGVCLALCLSQRSDAQESRSLNIGTMEYISNEAFTGDEIFWPRGEPHTDTEVLDTYGVTIGIARDWTTPDGSSARRQVAQVMHNKFSDIERVTVPVRDGVDPVFTRVFRNPYPSKILDGYNWTRFFDLEDPVDPSIPSDAMLYAQVELWPLDGMGLSLERWSYAFAHPDYDDLIIHEYRLLNTSGEVREGVVIGLNADPQSDDHYPADLWGNYYGATYPDYVAGDATADSMRIYYNWRADRSNSTENDKGDPETQWGHFQEAHFVGFAVLHADTSPGDEADDPAQPFKAGWSQRDFVANLNEVSHDNTYEYIAGPWSTPRSTYSRFVDRTGSEVESGYFRELSTEPGQIAPAGIDLNTTAHDPEDEQEKTGLMSFGPYTMQPDEDVRIVTAFVAGIIPSRLRIDAGRAWTGGFSARETFGVCGLYAPDANDPLCDDIPAAMTYEDMHGRTIVQDGNVLDPYTGEMIAVRGDVLTREQMNQIIDLGQKLAFETAGRAIHAWKNSDVRHGEGTFNIPFAPASPSVEGNSEGDQIRLQWTDNTQDNSRGGTITGWRIYREYKRPPGLESPTDTTFLLLAEVPVSQTEYLDTDVVRGEQYYYYITAVNEDGVESSPFQNRTGTTATKSDEALVARSPANANWQDEVVVVPNPYHVQAVRKYDGRRLNFLNLPDYARIHIYTMTGDLVQTLEHSVDAGDEDWQRQDTFSTTEIVSGIYIYVVEKLSGEGGSPTGEQAIGKFVVVK